MLAALNTCLPGDAAQALGARIRLQGMLSSPVIKVVVQGGKFWFVPSIGPFATLDEAHAARAPSALKLQLPGALPAILLPTATKS